MLKRELIEEIIKPYAEIENFIEFKKDDVQLLILKHNSKLDIKIINYEDFGKLDSIDKIYIKNGGPGIFTDTDPVYLMIRGPKENEFYFNENSSTIEIAFIYDETENITEDILEKQLKKAFEKLFNNKIYVEKDVKNKFIDWSQNIEKKDKYVKMIKKIFEI